MRVRVLVAVVVLGMFAVRATAQCVYEWKPLGSGVEGSAYALATLNNELFAGGDFLTGQHVIRWNGQTWLTMNPALTGTVYALCPFNNQMLAGGTFVQQGGIGQPILRNTAKWDGTTWLNIGFGFNDSVRALGPSLPGGVLLAGGLFTATGDGVQTRRIGQLAGGFAWVQFSQGFSNGGVSALAAYDGKVIAGGSFTSSFFPVATVYGVAQCVNVPPWGLTWQPMGGGMTGSSGQPKSVKAFGIYNGELIAGGDFIKAGGVTCNYIAAWNGSNWRPLGTGMNGQVNALAVYNNELIAGGAFTSADGVSCNGIARWNGSAWTPLGSGVSGVFALTIYDGNLIAGGGFSTAGGITTGCVAQWGLADPLDSDCDGLLDDWELNGIPYSKSDGSTGRYVLPDANRLHKDLYVELDKMTGLAVDNTSQTLLSAAFDGAPENSPSPNPDDLPGISLHMSVDDDIPFEVVSTVVEVAPSQFSFPLNASSLKQAWFGTDLERTNDADRQARLDAKAKAYRYCLAINSVTNNVYGGAAELSGDDFVICVDSATAEHIAAVFMHELGHCLGLDHGGMDGINGKPHYPSIMNYLLTYKIRGGFNELFWRLDYSRAAFTPLNEAHLNETQSTGNADYADFEMPFHDPGGKPCSGHANMVLAPLTTYDFDLDCNSNSTDIPVDLNYQIAGAPLPDCANPSPGQTLTSWNDWQHITLRVSGGSGGFVGAPPANELSRNQVQWMHDHMPFPVSRRGDGNCDGSINSADIAPFVVALLSPSDYTTQYAPCSMMSVDMNGDGAVDGNDIGPFVSKVLGQ